MILEVKNLEITVETPQVSWSIIRDISFPLKKGEKLGIVGESGSGKTVLARSIIGLLPSSIKISSGTIHYDGQQLIGMKEADLQKIRGKEIGMVFQDPLTFLNPTIKIGRQIAEAYARHFPHTSRKESQTRALQLLQEVGIPDPACRFHQFPHEMSGGMRQRVQIAIALAAEPKILIADEPTTALDVIVQAQMMDLLRHVQQDRSIILISHDLSLVASFCDRVMVMYAGQIIEEAPTRQLFNSPQHPYTEQLLQAIPSIQARERLFSIPGAPPDLAKLPIGCAFAPRCCHAMERCFKKNPSPMNSPHKACCFLRETSC